MEPTLGFISEWGGWVMVKKETMDLQQCLEDLCLSLSHQYLPYHMGLFPFLLDKKPPHFIFGPSLSLYAPFHSLLMFPSKPHLFLTYQWSIGVKCQLGFLCLYRYFCIERKLVVVYYYFFHIHFLFIDVAIIKLSRKIPT